MFYSTSYTIQPSTEAERNLFRLQVQCDHKYSIYSHQTNLSQMYIKFLLLAYILYADFHWLKVMVLIVAETIKLYINRLISVYNGYRY